MNEADGKPWVAGGRLALVVRRRWWVITLCVILAAAAALAYSETQSKRYTASSALLFTNQSAAQLASGVTAVANNDPIGTKATNLLLVRDDLVVAQRASQDLGGSFSPEQVRAAVTATPQGDSNVVNIVATAGSPTVAARIANAFTKAFVEEQRQSSQATLQQAIGLVQSQYKALDSGQRRGNQGATLLDHLESLKILASTQGNLEVIQVATPPSSPSSPKTAENVLFGAVIGLVIGLLLAFQLERMDKRMLDAEEIETIYELPRLALVAHGDADRMRSGLSPENAEAFQMLRTQLRYFNVDRRLQTVLVTSAESGEGKTSIATGIAAAAARTGTSALLIEADLRKPTISTVWGLSPSIGLTGALVEVGPVQDAIRHVDIVEAATPGPAGPGNVNGEHRTLDVLPAGQPPPNPVALLESHAMGSILEWAKEHYELVVVDSAPLPIVPDAIPLIERVDGVIVVSRVGQSTRSTAESLRQQLERLRAPMVGVVINDVRSPQAHYGYGYQQTGVRGEAASKTGDQTPSHGPRNEGNDMVPLPAQASQKAPE